MKINSWKKGIVCALAVATAATALCACSNSSDKKYTVTFDTRGGSSISSLSLAAGESISRPSKTPTKEMFVFDDWYTDTTYTQKFEFGSKMPKYNITVYAGWIGEASIVVTYDANGGIFNNGATSIEEIGDVGTSFTATSQTPEREGYVFGGWYTDIECNNSYTFTVYPVDSITLYAGWNTSNDYAYVSYYGNGSLVAKIPAKKGSALEEPNLFSDDIISTGWYTDDKLETAYTFGGNIASDISLYTSYYSDGLVISDGTVTGYYGSSRAVVVPNVYDGNEVTTIGTEAFYRSSELTGITSVVLPDTVTKISDRAFYDCQYLVNAGLTSSVTEIGQEAFYRNERLKSVGDISSVTKIGEAAFQGCQVLGSIDLPETLTEIGKNTFMDCYALTSVTLPTSVNAIPEYAFSGCYSLVSVEAKSPRLTEIGEYAFEGCTALESLTLRSIIMTRLNKSTIGIYPIEDCENVTVYVPSNLLNSYVYEYTELEDRFASL